MLHRVGKAEQLIARHATKFFRTEERMALRRVGDGQAVSSAAYMIVGLR
jgi:hypothetical protein